MSHIIPGPGMKEIPGHRSGDLALILRKHGGAVRIHVEHTTDEAANKDRKIIELSADQIVELCEFLMSEEDMTDRFPK